MHQSLKGDDLQCPQLGWWGDTLALAGCYTQRFGIFNHHWSLFSSDSALR